MKNRLRLSILVAVVLGAMALPVADASAASCVKSGYKVIEQSKYIRFERGPIPKGDTTSKKGFYACRIKTGKRYLLGGDFCFGNDLGEIEEFALAGNYVAYEAYTCGDPEGEADAKRLNVATGAKASFSAEQGPITEGNVEDYSITDIVVKANGNMAWIALAKQVVGGNQTRYDVRRAINGVVDRVDFGPNIVADSLALSGGNIFWLEGNNAKSASLP
ncbi:MAG: hypothetical protein M3340_06835 [Actinomycetota bacterium]|nr:hypothetical protein [Actinomycetota bacterium]